MTDVLEKVKNLRKAARTARDAAVLDHDLDALDDARSHYEEAIALLTPLIPARDTKWSETDKEHAQRLYQCLGSLGGTWRDAAELEPDTRKKQSNWNQSITCYDDGYKIESGTNELYPDFKFCDSYNLLQRLVVRILREPRCLVDGDKELGRGLNVPKELANAEREINNQLDGPRKEDAWAMADLAALLILHGQSHETAWHKFAERNRSSEAYETNHRAFASLMKVAEQAESPPPWLSGVKNTVLWLAERLKTLYGIEV
jgi:tetratricopeptide (TPR) repeat protein